MSGTPVKYHINTISDSVENSSSLVYFEISSLDKQSFFQLNDVMVVKHIPVKWPSVNFDVKKYPFLDGLTFPKFSSTCHADILIGVDNAHLLKPLDVVSNNIQGNPYAILTVFGWTICGPVQGISLKSHVSTLCVNMESRSIIPSL